MVHVNWKFTTSIHDCLVFFKQYHNDRNLHIWDGTLILKLATLTHLELANVNNHIFHVRQCCIVIIYRRQTTNLYTVGLMPLVKLYTVEEDKHFDY